MIKLYRNYSCSGWHIHPEDQDARFACWWAASGTIKLTGKSKLADLDPHDFLKAWDEAAAIHQEQVRMRRYPPMINVFAPDIGRICCVCAESLVYCINRNLIVK